MEGSPIWIGFLFSFTLFAILLGYPVAFTLSGCALITAAVASLFGAFDMVLLSALPERLFGIVTNETLVAIPLFIFMGSLLEKSKVAEELILSINKLLAGTRGGLAVAICLVGGLLAASTGIVGATVVTMGLISLPSMLKQKYSHSLTTGIICASGTLGQIIPPSIVLIVLADVIATAHQQAQLNAGIFAPETISVTDLFLGALIPGALLMSLYIVYVLILAALNSPQVPTLNKNRNINPVSWSEIFTPMLPPLILILAVLGTILFGIATPMEAASFGCVGSLILFFKRKASVADFKGVLESTAIVNTMVFTILIGATVFSLVFRGLEGDEIVSQFLTSISGNKTELLFIVMILIFALGFFLDFFEICFVVVPIVGPILLAMDVDPIWLGIMIALNLQTSFLTPPLGFALF